MSRLMPNVSERSRRHGMTLVEILISLVLLGIVSGVIMRVVMRQQRFYQGVNQIISQRSQLRQATSVLPTDLRSLSSKGNDILVASDSSMEIMVEVGISVVCEVIGGDQVALLPEKLKSTDQTLTSWFGYGEPDPTGNQDYTVYIYNDSSFAGNEDDRWQPFMLNKIYHDKTRCITPPGFATITDVGLDRYVLQLKSSEAPDPVTGGPLSQYIGVGAPVRILKRVRYKLYQETDGKWYLGYSEYDRSAVSYQNLSPVSGPFDPYTGSGGTGIGFRYYDVDGNEIASGADATNRARIARIDLIARARTSANVRTAGIQNGADQQYRDSLAVSVMLRNRN